MAEVAMDRRGFTEKKVQSYMVEFQSFLALNPSINSPIFLYLVNIIQARCLDHPFLDDRLRYPAAVEP